MRVQTSEMTKELTTARADLRRCARRTLTSAPAAGRRSRAYAVATARLCRFEHDTPILRAQYIEYQRMNTALGEQVERLQARPAFAMP